MSLEDGYTFVLVIEYFIFQTTRTFAYVIFSFNHIHTEIRSFDSLFGLKPHITHIEQNKIFLALLDLHITYITIGVSNFDFAQRYQFIWN